MQTTQNIRNKKGKEKIIALTSYDYWMTLVLNEIGVDIIIVGDSLGMVMLGYKNTIPVTMKEMLHHTKAVTRGNKNALVVGDMPFMSDLDLKETVKNAGRFLKEGGAGAVKIEGGIEIRDTVKTLVEKGIPVMGHIGVTPQDVLVVGGYKVKSAKEKLLEDAVGLQESGAFSIILECVPAETAKEITETIKIPAIGIGSGPHCDGQVLVTHDLLGICPEIMPKFVKPYANLRQEMISAINKWKDDINKKHS